MDKFDPHSPDCKIGKTMDKRDHTAKLLHAYGKAIANASEDERRECVEFFADLILALDGCIPKYYGRYKVMKSDLQVKLEKQGCLFRGQERLDEHEANPDKPCYCGRPNVRR